MNDPAIKTKPLSHQATDYERFKGKREVGLLWDPGLGKTKELLDLASHLWFEKKIDAVLVIAPGPVYTNWISQEIPPHLAAPHVAIAYKTGWARTDEGRIRRLLLLDPSLERGKLRVIAMSYDSVGTDSGFQFAMAFVKIFRTFVIVDESTSIAAHNTERTKRVKKIGKHAHARGIATGTPIAEGPFKIHSQIEFLNPNFWKQYGLRSYGAFKSHFGVFEKAYRGGRQFDELKEYQRLDELQEIIKGLCSRVQKEEVLDLPPKLYTLRTFQLEPEQRRIYQELKDEYVAELESGAFVEAPLAIVRFARFQQITSGFITAEMDDTDDDVDVYTDDDEEDGDDDWHRSEQLHLDYSLPGLDEIKMVQTKKVITDILPPEKNPRLDLLLSLLEERYHKTIVWCRFKRDIVNIEAALTKAKIPFLSYHGGTPKRLRPGILDQFRDPKHKSRVLVANTNTISQGVTLTIAKTMIYYTNSFSLERRLQSEDRFHRIGQDQPVQIIDIAAEDTIDLHVITRLKQKFDLAVNVMGDRAKEWIQAL